MFLYVFTYQIAAEFDKLSPHSAFMFRNFEKLTASTVEVCY